MALTLYLRDDLAAMLAGLVAATVEAALASRAPNWERLAGQLAGYRAVAHCVQVRWADVMAGVDLEAGEMHDLLVGPGMAVRGGGDG